MPASSRSNCPRCSTRPSWSVVAMFASICLRVQETDIVARTGHFSTLHNPDVHPFQFDNWNYGYGPDTIKDFERGVDKLDFRGTGLAFEDLAILEGNWGITITDSRGNFVFLEGMNGESLDSHDFLF